MIIVKIFKYMHVVSGKKILSGARTQGTFLDPQIWGAAMTKNQNFGKNPIFLLCALCVRTKHKIL